MYKQTWENDRHRYLHILHFNVSFCPPENINAIWIYDQKWQLRNLFIQVLLKAFLSTFCHCLNMINVHTCKMKPNEKFNFLLKIYISLEWAAAPQPKTSLPQVKYISHMCVRGNGYSKLMSRWSNIEDYRFKFLFHNPILIGILIDFQCYDLLSILFVQTKLLFEEIKTFLFKE